MQKLLTLFSHKLYWLALTIVGIAMLGVALYYQHVLGDEPCQVCIHIRIWVIAFTLLSLVMLALPSTKITQLLGHAVNTGVMAGLWERCLFLLQVENGNATSSCNFYLGFPDWFALDKWMPEIFEVRNLCSFTPEMLFGITMAQSLMAMASAFVIVSALALIIRLFNFQQQSN